jgi:hypothetical protein
VRLSAGVVLQERSFKLSGRTPQLLDSIANTILLEQNPASHFGSFRSVGPLQGGESTLEIPGIMLKLCGSDGISRGSRQSCFSLARR